MNKTTKTAQFTPGPWNAYNVHKGRILKHWQVDTGTGKVMLDDAARWEAGNATLIAAAPAMYAALQMVSTILYDIADSAGDVAEWNEGGQMYELSRVVKTALSQAEGRQHE